MSASITLEGDTLVYRTPYEPMLVAALKGAVPATDRTWDPGRKVWLVAPAHGAILADLAEQYLGESLTLPVIADAAPKIEQRILDVRYIGRTKDRGDGNTTAFGWSDGGWSVIFPETVLRDWFGAGERRPDEVATLYAVLGVQRAAEATEIRSAYRRLARQWHPDMCKEPDAAQQFIRIQRAHEVLSDDRLRSRYDAGLLLEASAQQHEKETRRLDVSRGGDGYRSPFRCGMILATGANVIGRFIVSKIYAWEDVTDNQGLILVTSWPLGAEMFEESWQ